ncbi:MAG: hypothetical protein H8E55_73075 [Pelagibacterales bacterium]|nr:hypothetical protein [Pelagibacterales bacterium]
MSSSKNRLQVFEHHTLKVDEESPFKITHFNALEKYGYKTKEKFFSVGNKRIKFNNYVGVIQVKNLTIEILPKADNKLEDTASKDTASKDKWHNALITMLKECKLIKLNTISNAKLKLKSASILDLYYDLFLSETETIFKHGLRKNIDLLKKTLIR